MNYNHLRILNGGLWLVAFSGSVKKGKLIPDRQLVIVWQYSKQVIIALPVFFALSGAQK